MTDADKPAFTSPEDGVDLSEALGAITAVTRAVPPQVAALLLLYALYRSQSVITAGIRVFLTSVVSIDNLDVFSILESTLSTTVFFMAALIILGSFGVDVSSLVAGLGLSGFALGYALRDVLSNLLAGILILLYQPFVTGDNISVNDQSGRVTKIDLRYTQLVPHDDDASYMLIPNSKVFSSVISVEKVERSEEETGPAERRSQKDDSGGSLRRVFSSESLQ